MDNNNNIPLIGLDIENSDSEEDEDVNKRVEKECAPF